MSLAHHRAVMASLVTGGFLLSGLGVSTQNPAFASAATASPKSSPAGRLRWTLQPRCEPARRGLRLA